MQHVDQQTLDAVINRTVSEAQVARIKEHVRICRVCARLLEEYRDLFSEIEVIIPTAERDVVPKPAPTKTWREVIRPRFDDAIPSSDKAIKIGVGIVAVLVIGVVFFLLRSPATSAGPIVLQPVNRAATPAAPAPAVTSAPSASISRTDSAPSTTSAPPPSANPAPSRTTASMGSATPATLDPPKPSKPAPVVTTPKRTPVVVDKPPPKQDVARTSAPATAAPPRAEGGHTPLFHRVESTEAIGALGGSMKLIDGIAPDHFELAPGNVVPGAAEDLPVVRVIYKMNGSTILLDQQRHPEIASRESSSGSTPEGVSVVQWSAGDFWLTLAGRVPADTLELLARRIR